MKINEVAILSGSLNLGGEEMRYKKVRLAKMVTLHGKAWLAMNEFVEYVLTQKELQRMENSFDGREFYPQDVFKFAKKRLNDLWFEVNDSCKDKK